MTHAETLAMQQAELDALSQHSHVLHLIDFDADYAKDMYGPAELSEATAFSSEIASGKHGGKHTVAIDLDVPARLVSSTTPGHSHLYIDVPMTWPTYLSLLHALAEAGVIEDGYYGASERRGFTSLRLPWVKKGQAA